MTIRAANGYGLLTFSKTLRIAACRAKGPGSYRAAGRRNNAN